MDELDETEQDVRDAFEDLRMAAGAEPQQRRALKAVLNELYRLQEYRLGPTKVKGKKRRRANKKAYFGHAESCDSGKVTLGVVYLRGVLTHHLTKPVQPVMQQLYPGETVHPGPDVYPGPNIAWISAAELKLFHKPDPEFAKSEPYYISHVGGHLVLPTIRQAIEFLLADPVIVTLK